MLYSIPVMQSTEHMSWVLASGQYGKLHTLGVYMYAKATETLELKHRQNLHRAKAVSELHVPVLQFIKEGSVSVRKLDSKM